MAQHPSAIASTFLSALRGRREVRNLFIFYVRQLNILLGMSYPAIGTDLPLLRRYSHSTRDYRSQDTLRGLDRYISITGPGT